MGRSRSVIDGAAMTKEGEFNAMSTFRSYLNARYSAKPSAAPAHDTDWQKHDARFHGGHFDRDTQRCTLRDDLAKTDGIDDLGNPKSDSRNPEGPKRWIEFLSLIDRKKGDREVRPSDIEQMYGELQKIKDKGLKAASAWWLAHGTVKLPEDMYKIEDAVGIARKAKKDALSYTSPMELISSNKSFKTTGRAVDPDTVPELSDRRDMGHGVVTYLVQDDKSGQAAMRRIIDTHWGEDANPWCLLARSKKSECPYLCIDDWWKSLSSDEREYYRGEIENHFDRLTFEERDEIQGIADEAYYEEEHNPGELYCGEDIRDIAARRWWRENIQSPGEMTEAWRYWNRYSALPKRVAFKDGKLLAFMATAVDNDMGYDDIEYRIDQELNDEFEDYLMEHDDEDVMLEDWLQENHPDAWRDLMGNPTVAEQWWDRMDHSHDGIPLGNLPVSSDAAGLWSDYELLGGKMVRVGDYHRGEKGKDGFVEWEDDGRPRLVHSGRMGVEYFDGEPIFIKMDDSSDDVYDGFGYTSAKSKKVAHLLPAARRLYDQYLVRTPSPSPSESDSE